MLAERPNLALAASAALVEQDRDVLPGRVESPATPTTAAAADAARPEHMERPPDEQPALQQV